MRPYLSSPLSRKLPTPLSNVSATTKIDPELHRLQVPRTHRASPLFSSTSLNLAGHIAVDSSYPAESKTVSTEPAHLKTMRLLYLKQPKHERRYNAYLSLRWEGESLEGPYGEKNRSLVRRLQLAQGSLAVSGDYPVSWLANEMKY